METLLVIMAVFLALVFAGAFFWLLTRSSKSDSGQNQLLAETLVALKREMDTVKAALQEQSLQISQQMNQQLTQSTRFLTETHQNYQTAIHQVQHRLGELQEAAKSMQEVGRDISSLQDILRSPKLRGGMGELFLGELLRQILPEEHYTLQYGFRDGKKVDAVISLGSGLVPVDAKFPLENFRRIVEAKSEEEALSVRKAFNQDVKKHIDSIASKYILPEEGTFDFALMYIPAENVYYETIIRDDAATESIGSYALKKKVIPVSPNTFYAYLQAIVRGLKGLRIEKSAQKILESLGQLDTDFSKFLIDFEKLGGHLSNAQASYERSLRVFERLKSRFDAMEKESSQTLIEEPAGEKS